MSTILPILLSVLGMVVFLFMFWRRLKEDYASQLVFSSGFIILISTVLSADVLGLIVRNTPENGIFVPSQFWFWGGTIGFVVGLSIVRYTKKLKLVETFEAAALAGSIPLATIYFSDFVKTQSAPSAAFGILIILLLVIFYFLERRYRRFSWYKSGRVGFSGLAVVGIFFLLRIIAGLTGTPVFSIMGKIDIIVSAVSAFLIFFSLYNLAES